MEVFERQCRIAQYAGERKIMVEGEMFGFSFVPVSHLSS
jgi:hypothetical protein